MISFMNKASTLNITRLLFALMIIVSVITEKVKESKIDNDSLEIIEEEEIIVQKASKIDKEEIYNPNLDINLQSEKVQASYIKELETVDDTIFFIFSLYEVLMIVFLLSYIFVCITGKFANDGLASKWVKNNKQYFINNYAHVGTGTAYDSEGTLLQETYGSFKFYASGRKNINYTLVSLDLQKRFDLVSLFSSLFYNSEKDKIIYEIGINTTSIPLVFSLSKKKDVKYMKKTYPDIENMTELSSNNNIGKGLVLLTEDEEITDKIFLGSSFKGFYSEVEKYIDIIYFTDRQTYSKEKHILFCSFNVSSMQETEKINKFVHLLADKITNLDYSNAQYKLAEKRREEYENFVQKKILAKQKENETPKEKEKKQPPKNLTKDQLQKLEEKERKEKIKKQRAKITKVMK